MENLIKKNLNNPSLLESSYRSDRSSFRKAFEDIYDEISYNKLAEFWKVRLESEQIVSFDTGIFLRMIIASVVTGVLIHIPEILGFNPEANMFYLKNIGLIVFTGIASWNLLTKKSTDWRFASIAGIVTIGLAVYVNLFPSSSPGDAVLLALLHLPLFLWGLYGLIYIDFDLSNKGRRFEYLKHNGDLAIFGVLIAIGGGILTGVTLGLFQTIGLNIEEWYFEYIVLWGIVAAPVVASYILISFPNLTGRISSVIANLFSPLVVLTLLVFLISIPVTGQDPYSDREFLLIFNVMLLGVMAIIVFSVAEGMNDILRKFNSWVLLALVTLALIVDVIALSAIIYRLGEFGFSPNRVAVLGSNLLILGNLILVFFALWKVKFAGQSIEKVQKVIAGYLPIYLIWTLFVIIGFPAIFGIG